MKKFKSETVRRTYTSTIMAAPEAVFPLLCPVREEEWVIGWEHDTYELIHSMSGYNEEGCIFRTSYPDGFDSIWVCLRYDKENFIADFFVTAKEIAVRRMIIRLRRREDGMTEITFEYALTAISEQGNLVILGFTEEAMAKSAGGLAAMLNGYLTTGTKTMVGAGL